MSFLCFKMPNSKFLNLVEYVDTGCDEKVSGQGYCYKCMSALININTLKFHQLFYQIEMFSEIQHLHTGSSAIFGIFPEVRLIIY